MKLTRNSYLAAGTFVVAFLLLLRAGSFGDLILRAAIWGAIVLMSMVVVVRTVRRRGPRAGGYGQDAVMPEKIRRWVLDEPDSPPESTTEQH